jgi:transposase-like protein
VAASQRASSDPRYDEALRDRARRLYEDDGLTVREVAHEMGVSPTRAWTYLHDAGTTMRRPGKREP